ncbi:hypothetical protein H8D30_01245 [bacterium]|nr:hypothetical protein [bacterium]
MRAFLRQVPFLLIVMGGIVPLVADTEVSTGGAFTVAPFTTDHLLALGSSTQGRLLVTNKADETLSFSVSLRDFTTNEEGVDLWEEPGSHARSLGNWITFSPAFLSVPSGGVGIVTYEITVPPPSELLTQSDPNGSHWAAIVVKSERERREWEEVDEGERVTRFGIGIAFAYAIKIYVQIDGTLRYELDAEEIEAGDGVGEVVATFRNVGNVILRPKVWMEIRSLDGEILTTVESLVWTLQPGKAHRYRFSTSDFSVAISDGDYQLAVIADDGSKQLKGFLAPLHISTPNEQEVEVVEE